MRKTADGHISHIYIVTPILLVHPLFITIEPVPFPLSVSLFFFGRLVSNVLKPFRTGYCPMI